MFRPSAGETLRTWLLSALVVHGAVAGNPDAKRLYDDLLSNYNKLVRPVVNTSDVLRVCIKLKLSQLIDVGEVNVVQKKCRPFWRSGKPRRQILPYWNLSSSEAKFESDKIGIKTSAERKFKYDAYEKFYTEDTSEATELHQSKLVLKPTKGDKKIDIPPSCYYGKRNRKRKGKLSCSKNSCKKLTNVYTSEELRAILENFKIIHGIEGYNSSGDQSSTRVVPAYFVLKLAENSSGNEDGENSKGKCPSSTQSFKLIFANDKLKNSSKRKTLESSFQCKSCTLVKTKDKTAQTIQPDEGNAGNEIDNPKSQISDDSKTNSNKKICFACLKMEEDFKFQREFSSTLLDQMKNVLAQITCLIEILNHLLTDNKLNNKELNLDTITDRILKNICGLQHHYFGKNMKKLPRVLKNVESVLDSLTSFSFGSRNKNETVTEDESVAVLRNCYGTIGNGRMCPLFCHDKNENIYCMSHVESDYIEEPKRIGKITRRTTPSKKFGPRRRRNLFTVESEKGKLCFLKGKCHCCCKAVGHGLCSGEPTEKTNSSEVEPKCIAYRLERCKTKVKPQSDQVVNPVKKVKQSDCGRNAGKRIRCKTNQSIVFNLNESADSLGEKQRRQPTGYCCNGQYCTMQSCTNEELGVHNPGVCKSSPTGRGKKLNESLSECCENSDKSCQVRMRKFIVHSSQTSGDNVDDTDRLESEVNGTDNKDEFSEYCNFDEDEEVECSGELTNTGCDGNFEGTQEGTKTEQTSSRQSARGADLMKEKNFPQNEMGGSSKPAKNSSTNDIIFGVPNKTVQMEKLVNEKKKMDTKVKGRRKSFKRFFSLFTN